MQESCKKIADSSDKVNTKYEERPVHVTGRTKVVSPPPGGGEDLGNDEETGFILLDELYQPDDDCIEVFIDELENRGVSSDDEYESNEDEDEDEDEDVDDYDHPYHNNLGNFNAVDFFGFHS
jgi:hypothetical protein